VVQQAELAIQASSDQLVLGLAAPPLARLRRGIGHKVLLLQRLDRPNLLQERAALVRHGGASGKEPHPLGCHRPRIPDRVVFDKLIQVLVFGCGYRRIAGATCSATTLRRRRDEWVTAGVAERLRLAVLAADDRLFGLELEHLAVDGCITKAPCGGQVAGPSPVDRRKQGLKRSLATEATGIPLAVLPAPANHRDDGLLAATLDTITDTVTAVGVLPEWPVVYLDAGYDWTPCREVLAERGMVGEVAARGLAAPIQVGRRWVIERTTPGATSTASCAGAPSGAGWSWSSGWRWPMPPSSVAACSGAPGPATAGRVASPPPMTTCWRCL
jgi:hypothetical protein